MQHPEQQQRDQQNNHIPHRRQAPHSVARQCLPLLLLPREVDALYDALELTGAALRAIGVPFTLLAGSLLGAIRSRSILFCDDDIDIGVMACDYARVRSELPSALGADAKYAVRPWPAADRIRPRACPQVWIDVFVLQEYRCESDLVAVISAKENGTPQPADYVDGILRAMAEAGASYPCFHYDNRKAIEMWPREFFLAHELRIDQPRLDIPFAHLGGLPIPALPVHLFASTKML